MLIATEEQGDVIRTHHLSRKQFRPSHRSAPGIHFVAEIGEVLPDLLKHGTSALLIRCESIVVTIHPPFHSLTKLTLSYKWSSVKKCVNIVSK